MKKIRGILSDYGTLKNCRNMGLVGFWDCTITVAINYTFHNITLAIILKIYFTFAINLLYIVFGMVVQKLEPFYMSYY